MVFGDEQIAELISVLEGFAHHGRTFDSHVCFGCEGWHDPWLHERDCELLKALRLLLRLGKLPEWAEGKPLNSTIEKGDIDAASMAQDDETGRARFAEIMSKMT